MTVSPASVAALVDRARYVSLHGEWPAQRDQALSARLASRPARPCNVLLVNATMGLQLFPAIVDFFVLLRSVRPDVQVTATSWFAEVHELGEQVRQKGLSTLSIEEVTSWGRDELARFDVILCVGANELLMRWMTLEHLQPRLVLLDLGFYHQLIEATQGGFLKRPAWDPARLAQRNPLQAYTCQPERKVVDDLQGMFDVRLFQWHPLLHIPIGFKYCEYRASNREVFDVGLFGASARDYTQLEPERFRGLRVLFLGDAERVPEIGRLAEHADLHVIPRVDEVTYAKLLAMCRTVLLPLEPRSDNVLLSVNDALGSGRPLIATRQGGLARLEAAGAPMRVCATGAELYPAVRALLDDTQARHELARRSVAFAREHLDLHHVLESLVVKEAIA